MTATPTILAHAGGTSWDEMLCLLPVAILILVFLFLVARSRLRPGHEENRPGSNEPPAATQ